MYEKQNTQARTTYTPTQHLTKDWTVTQVPQFRVVANKQGRSAQTLYICNTYVFLVT